MLHSQFKMIRVVLILILVIFSKAHAVLFIIGEGTNLPFVQIDLLEDDQDALHFNYCRKAYDDDKGRIDCVNMGVLKNVTIAQNRHLLEGLVKIATGVTFVSALQLMLYQESTPSFDPIFSFMQRQILKEGLSKELFVWEVSHLSYYVEAIQMMLDSR